MNDQILSYMMLGGIVVFLVAWFWLLVIAFRTRWSWGIGCTLFPPVLLWFGGKHPRRIWKASLLLFVGVCLVSFPPLYTRLVPVDLGPREREVQGETHLTLTGWDRHFYNFLVSRPDVVVLNMANPDVDDSTVGYLKDMNNLRELDLSHTKITDASLDLLAGLPRLQVLWLKDTKITNEGFNTKLKDKDSLKRLDLSGTGVSKDTVEAWKSLQPGRKAILQ